jgi:hypothetical protein
LLKNGKSNKKHMQQLFRNSVALILLAMAAGCNQPADSGSQTADRGSQPAKDGIDRTILPIKAPERPTYTELDVRDAKAPERFEVKAPEGAPNVILVLLDDLGFAGTSQFGGPVNTPTF